MGALPHTAARILRCGSTAHSS